MKLLVIGSGGREHALAWRLARSPRVHKVYVAPGNGGTQRAEQMENIALTNAEELADFVQREGIALTVVGPEAPLAGEDAIKMQKLLDALEGLDDVQEVYTTVIFDEAQ